MTRPEAQIILRDNRLWAGVNTPDREKAFWYALKHATTPVLVIVAQNQLKMKS